MSKLMRISGLEWAVFLKKDLSGECKRKEGGGGEGEWKAGGREEKGNMRP
jgi:hypothetical protein